jgi:cytidine deaminase
MDRESLLKNARKIAERAYAPFSSFRVGAIVVADDQLYGGVNVENSSYGLSLCAERAALAAAITAGAKDIKRIAISCIDADATTDTAERMPCGACRQWLSELAPRAIVSVDGTQGDFSVSELLKHPFGLKPKRGR